VLELEMADAIPLPADERYERSRGRSPRRDDQGPLPPYRRPSPNFAHSNSHQVPPRVNVDEPTADEDETEQDEDDYETEDATGTEDDPEDGMDDATKREALQYWGQLFDSERRCTDLLNRLLVSTAKYIVCLTSTLQSGYC
jgi:hypothetical protein